MAEVRTVTRGGSRFYVSASLPDVRYPGVTSVVGMLPKPFLVRWAARMTARTAIENLAAVRAIAAADREGAVDYLAGGHRRHTRARADVGSAAHSAFERVLRGEPVGLVRPDVQRHVQRFREFVAAVNPELVRAEEVAWNDTHRYAGSFDAILRLWLDADQRPTPDRSGTPALLMVDYKTSKSVYPEVALQLAAYANAEKVIDAAGREAPMPEVDGAAVLHVTEERWSLQPVRLDRAVFDHFLTLRRTFDWDREVSRTALGAPIAKGRG